MSGHCRITPDGSPSGLASEPAGEFAPVVGRIETLVGSCTVSRSGAPPARLGIGDLVGPSDVIEASAGGQLSIRFADGTAFCLSDNARMALNDYVGDKTSALFDVSRGTFSFIAGKMAEAGRLGIQTPFASIRARRNGGGTGMLSLVSLFFAAFEEAHAAPSDISFLDDGNITSKDLGQFGIVELLVHRTATTPEQLRLLDDPGETIVIRSSGSSVSVDSVTNSIAQMVQYQAAQQEALHTFSVGLQQGQGPTGNGGGGSSTLFAPEILPPPQNINFIINNTPPPNFTPPPGPVTQQNNVPDPPPQAPPPPPPSPPSSAAASSNEVPGQTGSSQNDTANVSLAFSLVSQDPPTFLWSTGQPVPAAPQTALTGVDGAKLTFTGPNPTDFQFSVPDKLLDFLAQNQTLTVTYNVTVTDGLGHDLPQQVVITLTGSNDAPKITVGGGDTVSGPVTEDTLPTNASGTVSFSDVDLTNIHSAGFTPQAAGYLGTFTANVTHDSTNGATGQVTWAFTVDNAALQFLAAGETLTQKYDVTVHDGQTGGDATQTVTVTITGTNDQPVITSTVDQLSNTITETAGQTGDALPADAHHVDGLVTYTDVDLTDIDQINHTDATAAWTDRNGNTHSVTDAAIVAAADLAFGTVDQNANSATWTYTVADNALDFLREGETLTVTYAIQVQDDSGAANDTSTTRNIVITITGTNDQPVITSTVDQLSNTITETAGQTGDALPADAHHVDGLVTYTDVDLTDIDQINHTDATAAWTDRNGNTHSVTDAAIVAAADLAFGTVDQNANSATWTYTVADNALDFLREGETLTVTYAIQVQDDSGAANDTSTTRNIVITITGTNDQPVITSTVDQLSNTITETAGQTGDALPADAHHVDGLVTYTDVDLTDIDQINHTDATAAWTDRNGNTHSVTDAAIVAAADLAFGTVDQNANSATWTYTVADNALDFLREGETLTVTYAIQVQDDSGAANDTSTTRNIVITITGTNDQPVITSTVDQLSNTITETAGQTGDALPADAHHVDGLVTYTDVDLTDIDQINHTDATAAWTDRNGNTHSVTDAAIVAAADLAFGTVDQNANSATWTYTVADNALDFLREGETLTVTYAIQVQDDSGAANDTSTTRNIVITITGTNDQPVITSTVDQLSNTITETAGQTGDALPADAHHVDGLVTYTDVDLTDIDQINHTDATAAWTDRNGNTHSVTDAAIVAAADLAFGTVDQNANSATWTYTVADNALDFLREGETLTVTYAIQVQDDSGAANDTSTTRNIVITITGTNDQPVITSTVDQLSNTITETAGQTGDALPADAHHVDGLVTYTDVDLTDIDQINHTDATAAWTDRNGNTHSVTDAAIVAAADLAFGTVDQNANSATWTYTVADNALDFLREGETLTVTYAIQVQDDFGAANDTSTTRNIVITITGTNDQPVITSTVDQLSNTITETAGQTGDALPADAHHVDGLVTYTDVDLTDIDQINHTDATAAWTDRNGNTHSVTDAAIVAAADLAFGTVDQNANSATWTYTVADNALDFLREGETLTVTYAIQVQDDSGAANDTSTTRNIVITITGTNDQPVITSTVDQLSNTITETAGQTGDALPADAHHVDGLVTYTDVDLTDIDQINHTDATAAWTDRDGNTHSVTDAAIVAAADLAFGTVDQNANSATWTYTVADNALDFLREGETLTVTYAIKVQDDSGAANDTSTTRNIVHHHHRHQRPAGDHLDRRSLSNTITETAGQTGDALPADAHPSTGWSTTPTSTSPTLTRSTIRRHRGVDRPRRPHP